MSDDKAIPVTNLQVIKPSRKVLQGGDIFVLHPRSRGYFFGRVVRTDAKIRYMTPTNLVYLFAIESDSKTPPARLSAMQLLIPPLMTNRLPWSRGYFETVAHRGFEPGERLPVHCFRDWAFKRYERYWDDEERELSKRREPCGVYGLHSFLTIDVAVSNALGIPRASD